MHKLFLGLVVTYFTLLSSVHAVGFGEIHLSVNLTKNSMQLLLPIPNGKIPLSSDFELSEMDIPIKADYMAKTVWPSNSEKKYMFSLKKRMDFIEETFSDSHNISVIEYEGLTIEFCKKIQADFIIRGLRNPADFEFEKAIAHTNRKLSGIETVFLLTAAKTSFISSSIVREIISNQGDYTQLVPSSVRI